MMLYLNMVCKVTIGGMVLDHVTQFEISEGIAEMSNTAKITIPVNYAVKNQPGWTVLDFIGVSDVVKIEAGYYREGWKSIGTEFIGRVREIEADLPLVIHCDDETFDLRQNTNTKSYKNATLKEVLTDIIKAPLTFDCPDLTLGRFQTDSESSFQVLQRIKNDYGLYSRLQNGHLSVNLRDIVGGSDIKEVHRYVLNPTTAGPMDAYFVKKNELKFKRKEDYKLHVKVSSMDLNGKKITVEVGNKDKGASELKFTYPGKHTEKELRSIGESIYTKRCYNGYTGTITGFGLPRTHAGDALVIDDKLEKDRSGKYLIEKVVIAYNESNGYSRENTLSYRIE